MHPDTSCATLDELLARIGAAGGEAEFSQDELQHWPAEIVSILKHRQLLQRSTPKASTRCPGCERSCTMPVQWAARGAAGLQPFIVCDQREDIHRVRLDTGLLVCWQSGLRQLAGVLSDLLASGRGVTALMQGVWRVGSVRNSGPDAVVQLLLHDGQPAVQIAGHVLALAVLLSVREGRLVLDIRQLAHCAEHPVSGNLHSGAETPEQRRNRLRTRKLQLQGQGVKAFLQRLADEEGVSASMVKKILGREKAETTTPASPFDGLGGVSTKTPRQR